MDGVLLLSFLSESICRALATYNPFTERRGDPVTGCLFHMGLVCVAVPWLPVQPRRDHLPVGCKELRHALVLLSALFLRDLNLSKAYSIVDSGHLIVFPQEVENRGTENVRAFWKERGKSSKQGFGWTTPTFAVNVLIRGCGVCGGLAFHRLVCWNLCAVFQ